MAEKAREKKTYDQPTLEKKQKLTEVAESGAAPITGAAPP